MLDFENLPAYMDYLAGSVMLSPEQRAAVQSSLVILKHQMKFTHLCFWGRIHGSLKDYYIVQGVEGIDWYNRRTLFSQVYLSYFLLVFLCCILFGWLGSRVVSVLDSGAEGPGSSRSRYAVR